MYIIVCVFWSDQPSLKLLWVSFVQNIFCVWVFKGRMVENLNFGKTFVLEKHFISYSCIFISYIQCFEVYFQKLGYFSKKVFFQIFNWSNLFFDESKSLLKILVSLCLVRLIEPVFRSIEIVNQVFKKFRFDLFKPLFQKLFKPLSLSPTRQGSTKNFLSFSSKFLARFLSP